MKRLEEGLWWEKSVSSLEGDLKMSPPEDPKHLEAIAELLASRGLDASDFISAIEVLGNLKKKEAKTKLVTQQKSNLQKRKSIRIRSSYLRQGKIASSIEMLEQNAETTTSGYMMLSLEKSLVSL